MPKVGDIDVDQTGDGEIYIMQRDGTCRIDRTHDVVSLSIDDVPAFLAAVASEMQKFYEQQEADHE